MVSSSSVRETVVPREPFFDESSDNKKDIQLTTHRRADRYQTYRSPATLNRNWDLTTDRY